MKRYPTFPYQPKKFVLRKPTLDCDFYITCYVKGIAAFCVSVDVLYCVFSFR